MDQGPVEKYAAVHKIKDYTLTREWIKVELIP